MNREIKFIAWLKNTKKMVFVEEVDFYNDTIAYIFDNYAEVEQEWIEEDIQNVELLQFIGCLDKNGNEIYEGYIVHFKMSSLSGKGIVYWNEEVAQFWIEDIREQTKKRGKRYYPFYKNAIYRIDGNIYENPELLEVKQ